jgi:quercetin dioxygenase-like cupin family protein
VDVSAIDLYDPDVCARAALALLRRDAPARRSRCGSCRAEAAAKETAVSAAASAVDTATSVVHRDALPWAEIGPGVEMKLLRRGATDGVYTMLNRFAPGFEAPRHKHLGEVHAYTIEGRWRYREYDWVAGPGDYVYEPAGSVHSLWVPDGNAGPTLVIFTIHAAMELYDAEGRVFMLQDAAGMEAIYRGALASRGIAHPEAVLPWPRSEEGPR